MAVLYEIERYCNNYFNPRNDPDDPERNYPDAFLSLAERIEKFIENVPRDNITMSVVGSGKETLDLEFAEWQKAFARDLSLWKRAKFI